MEVGLFTLTPTLSHQGRGGKYSQTVIPAKVGIQGPGVSFDKLRTNELSVYLLL